MSNCSVCENCGKHHKGGCNSLMLSFGYGHWTSPKRYDVCDKKCALELVKKKTKNWGKWWA